MKKTIHIWLTIAIIIFLTPSPAWTEQDGDVVSLTGELLTFSGQLMTGEAGTNLSTSGGVSLPTEESYSQLIVSEVFFDGSDERIEITNIGSGAFLGSLVVQGVKSVPLSLGVVQMGPSETFLWGDNLHQLIERSQIVATGLGFSISDSNAIQVTLLSGELILDEFVVPQGQVSALQNSFGFEKLWSGGVLSLVATAPERVSNISGSRIANPGEIRTYLPPDVLMSDPTTGEQTPMSGGLPEPFPELFTGIKISEIHPGNDQLPEYLELHFVRYFSGELLIVGAGNGSAVKSMRLEAYTGQYVVISESPSAFVDPFVVKQIPSLSLTDAGEKIAITTLSGEVLDEAIYTGSLSGKSWYKEITTGIGFEQAMFSTPGFSEGALSYIPVETTQPSSSNSTEPSYYESLYRKWKDRYYELKTQMGAFGVAVNQAGMVYRKEGSSQIELVTGSENFADITPDDTFFPLQIDRILPDAQGKDDNNEQVVITLLSGDAFDLQQVVLVSNGKKSPLHGLVESGQTLVFKGSFGLLNKPSCVSLHYQQTTLDEFCYGQPSAGVRISTSGNILGMLTGNKSSLAEQLNLFSLTLSGSKVCALFDAVSFNCLNVSGVIDENSKAKYAKKMASLQKKYDNKQRQYTGLQERYSQTKSSLESKRRKYYNQLKVVRSSFKTELAQSAVEMRLWKNYGELLQADLKKNWYVVWQNSSISFIYDLLQANLKALDQGADSSIIVVHGQQFTLGDLKKQYLFASDSAMRLDFLMGDLLSLFEPTRGEKRRDLVVDWHANE